MVNSNLHNILNTVSLESQYDAQAKKVLAQLGFVFEDSKANFIFASHRTVPAKKIYQALR